jgi:replicative DNA helicase
MSPLKPNTPYSSKFKRNASYGYGQQEQFTHKNLAQVSSDLIRRVPPNSPEAEQSVLGGILIKNSMLLEIIDILGEDDFYSPIHRAIYQACLELNRRSVAVDLVTLANELSRMDKLDEVGGPIYLAELASATVSAANAVHHAQIVLDKAIKRRLISAASGIIEKVFEGADDTESLLDASEKAVFAISDSNKTGTVSSSKTLVTEVFDQLTKRVENHEVITGVPTGYYDFDEFTSGLQRSDLIIVAGRPSMGKTAFAMNLAMRAACSYATSTAIFSLEMSKEQIMMRMLCAWGKVDLSRLRRGHLNDDDWSRLYNAANALSSAPIFVDDTPSLSTMELRSRCRRLAAEHSLGLVVVDYLQLMRSSKRIDSREQEISDISRNLKALAKELHVPVIALSQLNRKLEDRKRDDRRPIMSDLRESGAIEQDADVIIFLYRDAVYKKKEEITPDDNIAEIIIGKQRNGPTGTVNLRFFRESTSFENPSDIPPPREYEM